MAMMAITTNSSIKVNACRLPVCHLTTMQICVLVCNLSETGRPLPCPVQAGAKMEHVQAMSKRNLRISEGIDEALEPVEIWFEMFLVIAPASHGAAIHRPSDVSISWRAHRFCARVLVEAEHTVTPGHSKEFECLAGDALEACDHRFITDFEPRVFHPRQERQP